MLNYMVKRFLSVIPVLFMVTLVLFLIVHITPGGPASSILGLDASPEEISTLNQQMGYDQPITTQYANWVAGIFRGDLGNSIFMKQPVAKAIGEHLVPTLKISFLALGLALLFSFPAGLLSAYNYNSLFDRLMTNLSLLNLAIPSFVLALFLMLFFGEKLQWLPVAGYKPISAGLLTSGQYLILPAVSIAIVQSAQFFRITRTSMISTLGEPFIKTARAKGASEGRVVIKHALRNASLPLLTTVGQSFAFLITGSVVIEYIFVIPGMGQLMLNAIKRRDFPVIQGAVFTIALLLILINLIVDLLYCVIDKRIVLRLHK